MPRFLPCFVLSLLVSACASAANNTPPETPRNDKPTAKVDHGVGNSPMVFVFGWKVPCRVPVEQVSEEKGHKVRLRYMLSVKAGPEGKLDVDLSDFAFIELDGRDITSAAAQAELAPALALTAAMPTMVVSREGEYLGMRGLDAMVDRILAYKGEGMSKEQAAKVAATMRSPLMMTTLEAKLGDYWNAWVGAWAGLDLAPFDSRESDDTLPLGDEEIPVRLRYENHGPVPGAHGNVRLSLDSTLSGNAASVAVLAFARAMKLDGGADMDIQHVNIVTRLEVVTDPATLRPSHTRLVKTSEVVVKGARRKRTDVREETFDWEHAEGCR